MTVLALNDYSYDYVVEAIEYLRGERGVDAVALIGASTGAPPVIGAGIIAHGTGRPDDSHLRIRRVRADG
ncbi:MAG: hypothetical protein R3A46_08315 [Thermomicrobiales bacterium]